MIMELIKFYTREAGVRNLEREITNLIRKAIRKILSSKTKSINITHKNLEKIAGLRKFRDNPLETKDLVGITTGLAWTEVGGELLLIEAVVLNGKGRITSTGKLGDVMKESVRAAESYVKSRSLDFGIKPEFFSTKDIHVHVPEGATPKDGPSAINTVLIPAENKNELMDIQKKIIKTLKIIMVSSLDEVLKHALTKKVSPIDWNKLPLSKKTDIEKTLIV